MHPKILTLDIETKPATAYVWGLFKVNIGIEQIKSPSEVICFAAKWYGESELIFKSTFHDGKKKMLKTLYKLLNEADIVVHFNGRAFDIKTINKELITNNMNPPSPYRQVDLIETARHTFNFQSNKLDFLCQQLKIGKKLEHEGFSLWKKCMDGDSKAWDRMKRYNIKDVIITEKLYERLRPWISNHPNVKLYDENSGCPKCGSKKFKKDGKAYTKAAVYQAYKCSKCRGYFRGTLPTQKADKLKVRNTDV